MIEFEICEYKMFLREKIGLQNCLTEVIINSRSHAQAAAVATDSASIAYANGLEMSILAPSTGLFYPDFIDHISKITIFKSIQCIRDLD